MTFPTLTPKQSAAIRNLMFSTQNIQFVLDYMLEHGKLSLNDLSIRQAMDIISALANNHLS